jgi:hypothetical protein
LCFYGITVFSATVRLAEKIADRRNFNMKYDFEIPVHDIIGRQQGINKTSILNRTTLSLSVKNEVLFFM